MDIADVEIGQELVYQSRRPFREYGPRIRVTRIQRAGTEEQGDPTNDPLGQHHYVQYSRITGIVLDPMQNSWPVDSQFMGLAEDFYLPEDVPEGG